MYYIRSNFSNDANYARDLIYKKNHPVTTKQVVTVVDLGYLGVEMISQNNYHRTIMQKEKKPARGI